MVAAMNDAGPRNSPATQRRPPTRLPPPRQHVLDEAEHAVEEEEGDHLAGGRSPEKVARHGLVHQPGHEEARHGLAQEEILI
jgi:hypothetical protein